MTPNPPVSLLDLAAAVRQRRFSAVAAARQSLSAIESCRRLNAVLSPCRSYAEQRADEVEAAFAAGRDPGPLAGVPIAVKDNICTSFADTTCGSRILKGYRSPYDATVIERLEAAGALVVAKTNCDEFAMGSSNENSAFGPVRNPWDRERVPGGSSGGSAALVAAGAVPAALGSDTGGSIRQPASFCGIVGLKPTYGRVSRYGLVAYGSSLDQVGPLTRSVTDAAAVLEAIAGRDPRDTTSVDRPVEAYVDGLRDEAVSAAANGLRIGVPREFLGDGLDGEVRAAVQAAMDVYRKLGATIVEVSLPRTSAAIPTYYLVATAECSSNLARYDGVHYGHRAAGVGDIEKLYSASRSEGFGAEVKRRLMLGTYALSSGYYDAYYLKALKVRRLIQGDFEAAFAGCDVIAGPTAPTPAFRIGEKSDDPLAMYLADVYTVPVNLAGLPAISIPCGFSSGGLPIGLQLIGPLFAELRLLQAARLFERATDWHARRPPV